MKPSMFVAIAGLILIGYLSTLAFKLIITKMEKRNENNKNNSTSNDSITPK
jgi:hypothetical protein